MLTNCIGIKKALADILWTNTTLHSHSLLTFITASINFFVSMCQFQIEKQTLVRVSSFIGWDKQWIRNDLSIELMLNELQNGVYN